MEEGRQSDRVTASVEQVTISNAMLVEAIVQLLVEKQVITRDELMARVKKVKAETAINSRPVQ